MFHVIVINHINIIYYIHGHCENRKCNITFEIIIFTRNSSLEFDKCITLDCTYNLQKCTSNCKYTEWEDFNVWTQRVPCKNRKIKFACLIAISAFFKSYIYHLIMLMLYNNVLKCRFPCTQTVTATHIIQYAMLRFCYAKEYAFRTGYLFTRGGIVVVSEIDHFCFIQYLLTCLKFRINSSTRADT